MIEFIIHGKLPNALSPNGRAHWRTVAAEKKRWKNDAIRVAQAVVGDLGELKIIPAATYYHVIIGLNNRQFAHPGDHDNYSGNLSVKSAIDGLAHVLTDGDDSRWYRTGVEVELDPENIGYVKVVID